MATDASFTDDEYHPLASTDQTYALYPPTNEKVKQLVRVELRAITGGSLQQKKQRARTFGWDPVDVIPGYEREEAVEEDGEEKTVTHSNDLEPLSFPEHMRGAANTLFIGLEVGNDDADQLRIDEIQRAISDFTERAFGTSGVSTTL
jgi:hypothetical protein